MKNYLLIILAFLVALGPAEAQYRNIVADEVQGIAASQNLLFDQGWESGSKNKWVASGGTYAVSSSSPIRGNYSATWDSGSAAQTLQSSAITIPAGLYGTNGVASCRVVVASGVATTTIAAHDGTNSLASATVTNVASGSARTSLNFVFPSSGSIRIRFTSVASDEPSIKIDDCYLAPADTFNISQVSQASFYGGVNWNAAASCDWAISQTSAASNYSADSDCTSPTGADVLGSASAPATKVPAITFASMPPGRYRFEATGLFSKQGTTSSTRCNWLFHDGTTASKSVGYGPETTTVKSTGGVVVGDIEYTTAQSNVTINIRGFADGASEACDIVANSSITTNSGLSIRVYRFPSSSQTVYRSDQEDWFAIADISGANPSLGTASISSYTEIADAGLTMTPVSGSQPIGIMCSSTNAATAPTTSASTCAAGSESIGANFNIPIAGWYEVCMNPSIEVQADSGEAMFGALQIVETPTNAQTLTQECGPRTPWALQALTIATGADEVVQSSMSVCGQCNFSSAGIKGVRLMYEQVTGVAPDSVVIKADANASAGQRALRMTVKPMRYSMSTPLMVGSLTSNSAGVERIERAKLNCDASATITSQSNAWLSSIGNRVAQGCGVNITSGMFSATPTCVWSLDGNSTEAYPLVVVSSATSVVVYARQYDNSVYVDRDGYLICMGPR